MKVDIWQEQVIIPTYRTGEPDKNPMFFEKRVYQGSSGVVYPHPVIEKIEDEKVDQSYIGLFLENKYLKIMILPELGGRVQMAYDKIANRHFIYYNQVIKPALVGLCGPWISGGIEFNWPQHHRPSTFQPVDYKIDENVDGSKTVWISEVEKMFHTKGMAGFTLHPDKAYLEIKAQLYNRTDLPQTFLWWANPAIKVNDDYQSVFPPDVNAVFDHGKRDVSAFPIATGTYYKVDYSPGTDISRYKNIPVPTSYMAVNSNYNFVGGYEHDTRAGVLHVADHHVSPGKKQWTWGHGDFGEAWDRNLTDEDGPYIELMTGVFTDNQPDFSWLMPYEEKSFTQYFLPYRELGLVKNASKDLLIAWEKQATSLVIKIMATSVQFGLKISLYQSGQLLWETVADISPEHILEKQINFSADLDEKSLLLIIADDKGKALLRYEPAADTKSEIPEPAKPALLPHEIESTEQLFLTGQHLEQYRHATYSPVAYYQEALTRDPKDSRSNNAMGLWYLRKGQFAKSESYFKTAVATSIERNPNPYDSEPYYNLGLSLRYQAKIDEAYNAFFKATWSAAWQDCAYFCVAQIDILRQDYVLALEHINWALDRNARNNNAYLVKVHALRKLNRLDEAEMEALAALKRDQFNISVLFELQHCYTDLNRQGDADMIMEQLLDLSRSESHTLIDYSIEYADLGLYNDARALLHHAEIEHDQNPMLNYYHAYYSSKADNNKEAITYLQKGATGNPAYCFPNRLMDIMVLQYAISTNLKDAMAPYYLGNLWYDKRQYNEAISSWEKSVALNDSFPTVLRNLGISAFNKQNDPIKALKYFEKAYALDPDDARVFNGAGSAIQKVELSAPKKIVFLESHKKVAKSRDDLYLELISLYNIWGDHELAFQLIMSRKFHPWEGGEGSVSGQYVFSLVELAKKDLQHKRYSESLKKLNEAQTYPHNLGEGKLTGTQENDIFYWMGCAYEELQEFDNARFYWQKAAVGLTELSAAMFYNDQQPDKIFYQGLARQKMGDDKQAREIFSKLVSYGQEHEHDKIVVDYFAVSLPNMLIFDDDLNTRNAIHCKYLLGLGHFGLGDIDLANNCLEEVLTADAMHFGAKTHLELMNRTGDKIINNKA